MNKTLLIPKTLLVITLLFSFSLILTGCDWFYPPAEDEQAEAESEPEYENKLAVRGDEDNIVAYDAEAAKNADTQSDDELDAEESDIKLGEVEYESGELTALQEKVAGGEEIWRRDPEQVLIAEKEEYGFFPKDQFSLIQKTRGADGSEWLVYALGHGEETYIAFLGPAFPDQENSIWVWCEVRKNEQ